MSDDGKGTSTSLAQINIPAALNLWCQSPRRSKSQVLLKDNLKLRFFLHFYPFSPRWDRGGGGTHFGEKIESVFTGEDKVLRLFHSQGGALLDQAIKPHLFPSQLPHSSEFRVMNYEQLPQGIPRTG